MSATRHATTADLPAIMVLLTAMHAESRYREWPIHADKLEGVVRHLILHADGCCLVAEQHGELVGLLVGGVAEFPFSIARFAAIEWLYVAPPQRGSWAAIKLVHLYMAWAARTDAVEIEAGISAGIDDETAERFYSALGFLRLGPSFVKVLDHVRTR